MSTFIDKLLSNPKLHAVVWNGLDGTLYKPCKFDPEHVATRMSRRLESKPDDWVREAGPIPDQKLTLGDYNLQHLDYESAVIGMLNIFVTMHPKFQGPEYRLLRTLMFAATGFSGVSPLVHGINMFGLSQMLRKAFPYTLAKAGCLLLGTSFYLSRFPESQYPGEFDLCSSHSIFHILVVCAAIVQLAGYLDAFSYAHANLTCQSL
ncbi:hypothetical protein FOXG_21380 [Fusarium oxysporum f. sp. lycopersici 4287]|uniref:Uncharacterized protein n=1 Tax=Fusarium oxysporum f. sp. lycopersici (strain 4287 / CBS 123668 / FGSC 9935 / NRRL 34936) TaxID=426428 RepID=A0A0J9VX60_FUSO4|nr:hypothetical protein FOXG_21380 [Fusarium oxysporum f. sp. lycopersici 4287]KNB15564.1 hypothetical protein FOXG_21380 [Fusarium oxysporum f. sp. lycopersici 4287]